MYSYLFAFCSLLLPFYGVADESGTVEIKEKLNKDRDLYVPYPAGKIYEISTTYEVENPTGVAIGFFRNEYGTFVASASRDCIFFVDYYTQTSQLVAGTLDNSGSVDAQFNFALFNDPTRIAYDMDFGRLYVADKKNGMIRILTFNDEQVHTVRDATGTPIQFAFGVQSGGIFPGMDVQVAGDYLYVTDSLSLYSVTSSSGLAGLADSAVLTKYESLANYMSIHNYPQTATDGSYVYSVCPDEARRTLYVAIAFSKNVILSIPMGSTSAGNHDGISVLAGDEDKTFYMCYECGDAPSTVNGYYGDSPADVALSFPMHLRYSKLIDSLFVAETYPVFSDPAFLFGSQTIRKIDLRAQTIDTYLGRDFSHSVDGYGVTGTLGGYLDGEASIAEFSYPISIDVTQDVDNDGFPQISVADLDNNVIRGGATLRVPTSRPTPTATLPPTTASQFFTQAPTTASQFATAQPTTTSQFVTSAPTTTNQLVTAPPSTAQQFVTNAPTPTSQFVTSVPSTVSQFFTGAPSTVSEFATPAPSTAAELNTPAPSNPEIITTVPTAPEVVTTNPPTTTSQFFTNAPTTTDQFNTAPPTSVNQFTTAAPTTVDQFSTAAPSAAPVTIAPTSTSQFFTNNPTTSEQLFTNAPTTLDQFVTNTPTTLAQFTTAHPSPLGGFVSEAPTTVAQFSSSAPTSSSQLVTSVPTTDAQLLTTSSPTTVAQFSTDAPTLSPVTQPPTKVNKFVTSSPTRTDQFFTAAPTRQSEFVTSVPSTVDQFRTESPTRATVSPTASPTATPSTAVPSTASPTHPTLFPTTVDQFFTNAPTTDAQLHSAAPTTVAQFHTPGPTTAESFVTEAPTTVAQFKTSAPTSVNQFVTAVPTTVDQFSTVNPTVQVVSEAPTRELNSIQQGANRDNLRVGGELFLSLVIGGSCMCCCLCAYLLLLMLGLLKRDNKKEKEWDDAQAGDTDLDQIPNSHHELLAAIQDTMEAAAENGSESENTSVNPMFEIDGIDSAAGSGGDPSPRSVGASVASGSLSSVV